MSDTETCCEMRRKVIVGILAVMNEEECGISDTHLADFMLFDVQSPSGKPVLGFKYCPWCGKQRTGESRITETQINVEAEESTDEDYKYDDFPSDENFQGGE